MRTLNKSTHWEEFFIQESLELEEKMKTLDVESLNKSKLRICLEHGILDWTQYEKWYTSELAISSLKTSVPNDEINRLVQLAQTTELNYAQYDFWGNDLIPLTMWEDQLIVLGLQYNEKLVVLGRPIFILTSPEILTSMRRKMADQKVIQESAEDIKLDSNTEVNAALEGLNFNQAAPKISFSLIQPLTPAALKSGPENDGDNHGDDIEEVTVVSPDAEPTSVADIHEPVKEVTAFVDPVALAASVAKKEPTAPSPTNQAPSMFGDAAVPDPAQGVWEFIAERHQEYSFEAKKQFDAFVVLKISNNKTQVFKMDPDLNGQNVNHMIFEYSLEQDNPFKAIFNSRRSESHSLEKLSMFFADYQFACITPLLRGDKVLGFFVGFKKGALSQQDKNLLDELAEETAS